MTTLIVAAPSFGKDVMKLHAPVFVLAEVIEFFSRREVSSCRTQKDHPRGYKTISEYQPDFDADYDRYDWLIGEVEPGDVLLHHPKVVHGSHGNTTNRYRRALTNIYTGNLVTWNPHPASMFNNKDQTGHVNVPHLDPGGPIDCDLFPRVWSKPGRRRRRGPTGALRRRR